MSSTPRIMKRFMSYLIIIALLFSIVPVAGFVSAAESPIVISNPMGTESAPAQVSASTIDITGSFFGVTNLTYTITQMRKVGSNLIPIQSKEGVDNAYLTGSIFNFYGVELFDGLNEIVVSGTDTSGNFTQSERVYVEHTNLPIILTLTYNGQDLTEDNVINEVLYNDELLIKGKVLNGESIIAKVNGGSTDYEGTVLADDTYIVTGIPLRRGKNTVELIARNSSKEYPVSIEVIYDDGKPYASDILINADNDATVNDKIEDTTHITTNGNFIQTGVINNFGPNNDLEFLFNTEVFNISYEDFDSLAGSINGTDLGGGKYSYIFTKTGASSYEIEYDSSVVNTNDTNIIQITFTKDLQDYRQTYYLEHFDSSKNYITRVSGITETTTSRTMNFYVYTNTTGTDISATDADGTPITLNVDPAAAQDTEQMYKATAELVPGYNKIIVKPNGAGSDINKKEYVVLYINSPDVKIYNLVNGDRVGEGENDADSKLVGELVNIDLGDREDATITIENSLDSITYSLKTGAGGNFNDTSNNFVFDFNLIDSANGIQKLQIGANDITIKVTDGTTTTTTRFTVFYFSDVGPGAFMEIDEEKSQSINPYATFAADADGKISTEASYVYVKGTFSNTSEFVFYSNGLRVIQEDVASIFAETDHSRDCVATDPVTNETFTIKITCTSATEGTYSTQYPIHLNDGTNVIELEVVSTTGSSMSQKLYIDRITPPIKLLSPDLSREDVLNSNYVEVVVEAYSADSVIINKKSAELVELTYDELRTLIFAIGAQDLYDTNNDSTLSDAELKVVDQSEITGSRYKADVFLKKGKNTIKYEVESGGTKKSYEFVVYYAASPDEGARYKTDFTSKLKIFNNEVLLEFPKNTWLIQPDDEYNSMNKYISDAYIEFAIVDKQTGKLDKVWDTTSQEYVFANFNEPFYTLMPVSFIPPDRTGYAGEIYWIEASGNILDVHSGFIPTNRGELTLKYDPSIVNDSQNQLAIYHYKRDEHKWVNMGGVVNTKDKTVTVTIDELGYYTVMAKRGTYTDISNHSWAANYLQAMYSKGLMLPESYSRFGADLLTTRGEFATIIVKALSVPLDAGPYYDDAKLYPVNPTFVDVYPLLDPSNGFYTYEYVETAARAGIVQGIGDGTFNPDGLLTHEETAIIIARALNLKLESDEYKAAKTLKKYYDDVDKISSYNYKYVLAVTKAGIMDGTDVNGSIVFNPDSYLSRAEVAQIAYRLMVDEGLLAE